MDHEPEYSSVGTCGDLGSDFCTLCLPGWISWVVGESAALSWEVIFLDISLSSVHTWALLLFAIGRQIQKLNVWFLVVLNIAFHFQVCIINASNTLGTCTK